MPQSVSQTLRKWQVDGSIPNPTKFKEIQSSEHIRILEKTRVLTKKKNEQIKRNTLASLHSKN